jgi:hypothetical protein
MKNIFLGITICFLFLCSCLSYEQPASTGAAAPAKVSGPKARVPQGPEKMGLVFEWNNKTTPMKKPLAVGSNVYTGYNGYYFAVFGYTRGNHQISVTEDGGMRMGGEDGTTNEVLAVGALYGAFTDSKTHIPGQFNLSEGTFKLTLDYKNPVNYRNGYLMRISLNNNTGAAANTPLGRDCVLRHYMNVAALRNDWLEREETRPGITGVVEEDRLILIFTPSVIFADVSPEGKACLEKSFIAFLVQADSGITFTGIKLERVE